MSYCPDGKILASGCDDYTLKLWDVVGLRNVFTLRGHSDVVTSIGFSPDGETLASASWDKTVILWNVSTGEKLETLKGHLDWVDAVTAVPMVLCSPRPEATERSCFGTRELTRISQP